MTPVEPAGQTGGVSVPGPYYGLLEFVVDNLNPYYEPYMEIRAARLDPVTLAEVGSWHVDAAYAGLLLAPMRHVAAHAQGVYRLEFPGGPLPHDLEIRFENDRFAGGEDELGASDEDGPSYDACALLLRSWLRYLPPARAPRWRTAAL